MSVAPCFDLHGPDSLCTEGCPFHASVIDELASIETPNMAWLRRAGREARRLNDESRDDPVDAR